VAVQPGVQVVGAHAGLAGPGEFRLEVPEVRVGVHAEDGVVAQLGEQGARAVQVVLPAPPLGDTTAITMHARHRAAG
jgi:hypothetical protein